MSFRLYCIIIIFFCEFGQLAMAQSNSIVNSKSLINETMLHPGDAFTAYTLKKGEWIYNQAINPAPSWGWWGITDNITTELDLECWLGGVASFNFRFHIIDQKKWMPAMAYETMYQYIDMELNQFDNLDYLDVIRQGSNLFNRLNLSWNVINNLYVHASGGVTWSEKVSISNADSLNYIGKTYKSHMSYDYSLSIDYRAKKWLSLHATASNGITFTYADNIINKNQFLMATRVAPFVNSSKGFFNSLRFELAFLHANFYDAKESITGPIGYIYWQWQWSKGKTNNFK